jgi:hypothetical protein
LLSAAAGTRRRRNVSRRHGVLKLERTQFSSHGMKEAGVHAPEESQGRAYLSLGLSLLFPRGDETGHNTIALAQQSLDDTVHFTAAIVFLNDGLMLRYDHGDTLKERGQGRNEMHWRGDCNMPRKRNECVREVSGAMSAAILFPDACGRLRTRSMTKSE